MPLELHNPNKLNRFPIDHQVSPKDSDCSNHKFKVLLCLLLLLLLNIDVRASISNKIYLATQQSEHSKKPSQKRMTIDNHPRTSLNNITDWNWNSPRLSAINSVADMFMIMSDVGSLSSFAMIRCASGPKVLALDSALVQRTPTLLASDWPFAYTSLTLACISTKLLTVVFYDELLRNCPMTSECP